MTEPTTPTGQRLHAGLCDLPVPHGCHHIDGIRAIEREAVTAKLERLRLIADEHARRSAPPFDSEWTLHEAWEWVRDVFLAPDEDDRATFKRSELARTADLQEAVLEHEDPTWPPNRGRVWTDDPDER